MLLLLLILRPYSLKSGNWISIIIQVVRVLSVLCILVFVDQLGIGETPKAITGVVLVAMQSVLTGLLAILIAINGLIMFCKTNPHRKARKQAGKSKAYKIKI
jgi:Transient receptor potential (TRP) ion channel